MNNEPEYYYLEDGELEGDLDEPDEDIETVEIGIEEDDGEEWEYE